MECRRGPASVKIAGLVPAKSMVAVAQLVEHRIVIPVVAGSSPVSHPIFFGDVALLIPALPRSFTFVQLISSIASTSSRMVATSAAE